jgi:hypothetical protein
LAKDLIGLLSGILVVVSVIPYAIRTYQGKIRPNLTSWSLWSLIGLSLLLTYKSSGAEANVWPAIFGFFNPCLITVLATMRRGETNKLNVVEWVCILLCLIALAGWWFMRTEREWVQYALYIAIVADGCAAIPTIVFVWRKPQEDRPFAWGLFAIGYGLVIFAIPEQTFANYILPLWMFFGAMAVALPLAWHRYKNSTPITEWI